MIIRTYQRRNRGTRSLSESGNLYGDSLGSSASQESLWGSSQDPAWGSSQEPQFSSQESYWSQSDFGNSSRSFKSTRRQSHDDDDDDDDFGTDIPGSMLSRPSMSNTFSERPPLNSARSGDGRSLKGKLKKSLSDFPHPHNNGNKVNFGRGVVGDLAGSSKSKRESSRADAINNANLWGVTAPTSTLMEAQESGEMMEHVDEANFALDGLRKGQPVRIQRASLTSLLSLCGSVQKRRMLRTQGMAKPLLDAIVALPTDDPPLALAAAAVLYFLAIDSQDEDLLDSEPCVLFLMKLLESSPSQPVARKGLSGIGSRLAAFSKSTLPKSGSHLACVDRGAAVVTKVRDLFRTQQEHGAGGRDPGEENGRLFGDEISSKWVALLTLEKACISTVILEDSSSEAVRKVGGQFKERLRELGGLDAVCNLAASCLVNLTEALKSEGSAEMVDLQLTSLENNQKSGGIGVLLRCLRVMENVTFLSEQNQRHLLEMKLPRGKGCGSECFIGLTINAINTLSELARRKQERRGKRNGIVSGKFEFSHKIDELHSVKGKRQRSLRECFQSVETSHSNGKDDAENGTSSSGNHCSSLITFKRRKSSNSCPPHETEVSDRNQETSGMSIDLQDLKSEGRSARNVLNAFQQRGQLPKSDMSQKSAVEVEGQELFRPSDVQWDQKGQKRSIHSKRRLESAQDPFAFDDMERAICAGDKQAISSRENSLNVDDSQDPFAFDTDYDFRSLRESKKPRRESASKSKSAVRSKKLVAYSRLELPEALSGKAEESEGSELGRGNPECEEDSRHATLLRDCLLSGVKVLMNLTNGNPIGCLQVTTCGGFNSLSSLLIANYPWPRSTALSTDRKSAPLLEDQGASHVTQSEGNSEQDLDLLVAVLGVLCNLVEKDIQNRASLASLKVIVPPDISLSGEGKLWQETGIIGLLCSLFLLKQGAGEAAEAIESKRALEMHEEVKQGQAEAEDMIVEAYTALLLAFLSKESEGARVAIVELLPGKNLKMLVPVLERFLAFHRSLNMISEETDAVVTDVIQSCKGPIQVGL